MSIRQLELHMHHQIIHKSQQTWTIEDVATQPHWSPEQLAQVEGQCRGLLLRNWAANVCQRWGHDAVAQIRDAMGPMQEALPDEPDEKAWYPVALQLRLTDVIIEQFLDNDALALEALLHEDSLRDNGDKLQAIAKRMGPQILLRMLKRFHAYLYDVGTATSRVGWGKASILTTGSRLFANPTWQLLHLFGLRGMLKLAEKEALELSLSQPTSESVETKLRW